MRHHKIAFEWLLFGLGSQLQLWGTSLSFTELFIFLATPVLIVKEWPYLRRNGMSTFLWLSMAVVTGGGIACVANHTPSYAAIRGMAVVCLLPGTIVVGHWMLRRNMNGFKWFLVGTAISGFLSTFIFQSAVEVAMLSGGEINANTAEAIMSGPIYWISRLGRLLSLPAKGWYLQCPILYCVGEPLFMAGFSMATSSSGRSSALGALASAVLVIIGGKRQQTMRRIGRYFWILVLGAFAFVFVAKAAYQISATRGWLGEDALKKYEKQTKGDSSLGALIMGGRADSFCGILAILDHPIIGFGPWPADKKGYVLEFFRRYCDEEDFKQRLSRVSRIRALGFQERIGCHSYLFEFWIWYGIFGLIFWLYVLFAFVRYLRQDCWAVPQWYMWLAATIPGYCWGIFFSPWSNRVGGVLFIVACLMARAVRKGRQQLPMEMIFEIQKANNR